MSGEVFLKKKRNTPINRRMVVMVVAVLSYPFHLPVTEISSVPSNLGRADN